MIIALVWVTDHDFHEELALLLYRGGKLEHLLTDITELVPTDYDEWAMYVMSGHDLTKA